MSSPYNPLGMTSDGRYINANDVAALQAKVSALESTVRDLVEAVNSMDMALERLETKP